MWILKAVGLGKEMDGKPIFSGVDLEIASGERVALIGRNGVGKTTLLRCLTGEWMVDEGTLQRALPQEEYGLMEQQTPSDPHGTLFDCVCAADQEWHRARKRLADLSEQLADPQAPEGVQTAFGEAQEAYLALAGYQREVEVGNWLRRFQFPETAWAQPYQSLSGGEKTRAALVRLLWRRPKFLLLDEPTNHLDEESLQWLQDWLRSYHGTVLCVSHDRRFIDSIATLTCELTPHGVLSARGGYTLYQAQKEQRRQSQLRLYQQQESERNELLHAMQQYREWFQKGHDAASERDPFAKKRAAKNAKRFQAKKHALEQLEERRIEKPEVDRQVRMDFQGRQFEARSLVTLDGVAVVYGERIVLRDVRLGVARGDRIGVIGPNGAGKSTLLRLIAGELTPSKGQITQHPLLRVGYFEQELRCLPQDQSILSSLLALPSVTRSLACNLLAGFLFTGDAVHRTIGQLSMGERCRVAFLRLYLSFANLLVLDEPTNYLDIDTRERVEEALLSYPGSVVIVSHDRYLIDKVATRIVAIEGGAVTDFPGTRDEFERSKAVRSQPYEERERADEARRLELVLADLIARSEPMDEQARTQLRAEIHEVKRRLNDCLRR